MGLLEKVRWYYRHYGFKALLRKIRQEVFGVKPRSNTGIDPAQYLEGLGVARALPETLVRDHSISASSLLSLHYIAMQPLPVYTAPGPRERLNLVTDSINIGHLFGGVGTAIIVAAKLAEARGAKLRVVTRLQPADANGFAQVLECNGIELSGNVEFAFVGIGDRRAQLDITEGDRFLTTSWWTTASTLGSVPANRVDYLLQEDERMFYPYGDEWLRCNEVLKRDDLRFLINTKLLYDHLVESGLEHLRQSAAWFEPAFPESMFRQEVFAEKEKHTLFFYARPNNVRNLFYRGIEVLDRAVSEGLIEPDKWDVVFVGKDVPQITLGGMIQPRVLPTMGWREYGEFTGSVDLGFCLMGTPHPSYPPLDLAASGAAVLTNRFGLKQDLKAYSPNISCAGLAVEELLEGLREGLALATDPVARKAGYQNNGMSRSWNETLVSSIEFLR